MKKALFSSIVTIVLCLSLITGATFALFTSYDETNIAITSGTVDVKATFSIADVYSPSLIGMDGVISPEATDAADDAGIFANSGTVEIDGANVKITNMTPGDKVIFKVDITNSSSVEFLQRIALAFSDADKDFFNELLIGLSDTVNGTYTYYSDYATAWTQGNPVAAPETATKYLSVEMPACVGNDMQSKNCSFALTVTAVQGNTSVSDLASENVITVVDAAGVADAINNAEDGDVIFLNAPAATVNVDFDADKEVTLRGYQIDELNVKAPNGTLHVYNDIGTLTGENVAQHSLYVYGNIANIVLQNGRVVIENTAKVENVELAPQSASAVVKLEAAGAPEVENVVVNAAAAAKVVVTTPANAANVLPEVEYTAESKVQSVINEAVADDGSVMTVVTSSDELANAIANANEGDTILVKAESIEFPAITKAVTIKSETNTKITKCGSIAANASGVVIDGFNYNVSINYSASNLTIQNCTFSAGNGLRWCYNKDVWNIKNCVFDNTTYGIHFDGNSGTTLNLEGCVISGFSTFVQGMNVNAKNCVFTRNDKTGYSVFQTRGTTTITDCVIEASWGTVGADSQHFGNAGNAGIFEVYNTNYEGGSIFDLTSSEGLFVLNPTKNDSGLYTGGTFAAMPAAELIAEGYTAVENADGTYTIQK